MSNESVRILDLVARHQRGEAGAEAGLLPLVYEELRGLAARILASERANHTLQPTALVHEAWLRMAGQESKPSQRAHFVALAATMMRRVLIDHAKQRGREKRGGGWKRLEVDTQIPGEEAIGQVDLLALDEALSRLAALSPLQARLVELRFFGGLEHGEIAGLLGIAQRTLEREWVMARSWLRRALAGGSGRDG